MGLRMGGDGAISKMRSRHVMWSREVVWQKKTAHHCLSSHQHRPQHRQTVGPRVCLTRFWRRRGSLQPGQEGILVRDAHDYQPYYVRASNGGDGAISKMRSRHAMWSRDKLCGNTRLCITDGQAVTIVQQLARGYV